MKIYFGDPNDSTGQYEDPNQESGNSGTYDASEGASSGAAYGEY